MGMESVERLALRIAAVTEAVAGLAAPPLPELAGHARWVVTGVGASEGPARLFAGELADRAARFVPISTFLGAPPPADVLVVVSQGLSPNARLALRHHGAYRAAILVTARQVALDGVTVLAHGPVEDEEGLLRVLGPALATRMLLHLAEHVRGVRYPGALREAMARAAAEAPNVELAFGPPAILAFGADGERAHGLRTKLLEALLGPEPPIWDLCGVVHGPLQSFYDERRVLLVLEGSAEARFLRERLAQVIAPERHRLHVFRAELPGPLAYFEYAAAFDRVVLAALRARPRDLAAWPARGCDGAIYDLGRE